MLIHLEAFFKVFHLNGIDNVLTDDSVSEAFTNEDTFYVIFLNEENDNSIHPKVMYYGMAKDYGFITQYYYDDKNFKIGGYLGAFSKFIQRLHTIGEGKNKKVINNLNNTNICFVFNYRFKSRLQKKAARICSECYRIASFMNNYDDNVNGVNATPFVLCGCCESSEDVEKFYNIFIKGNKNYSLVDDRGWIYNYVLNGDL